MQTPEYDAKIKYILYVFNPILLTGVFAIALKLHTDILCILSHIICFVLERMII